VVEKADASVTAAASKMLFLLSNAYKLR